MFNQTNSQENTLVRDGATIAYRRTEGSTPGVIFMGGFKSDMTGTKAVALEEFCRARGTAFVRFDYQGHGVSSGRFEDGGIGLWSQDALAVFDQMTSGPQIIVGSSMGGWMMLLTALARPDRVAGLVGIAAAPDFTEDLIWSTLDEGDRTTLMETGVLMQPSEYGEPYPYTRHLIEDGRQHLLLRADHPADLPGAPAAWDARRRRALADQPAHRGASGGRGRADHPGEGRRPPAVARPGHSAALPHRR